MSCDSLTPPNVRKVRCYGIKRDSKYGLLNSSYQNEIHLSCQADFVLKSCYVRGTCSSNLPYPTPSPSSFLIRFYWVHIVSDLKTTLPQSESVGGLFWK